MWTRQWTNLGCIALAAACSAPLPEYFEDATCEAPGDVHVLADGEVLAAWPTLDGDYVYWASERGPRRVHRDGGVVENLIFGSPDLGGVPGPGIAVDGSYAYFGVGGAIWRVPKTGGEAERVAGASVDSGGVTQIVLDDEHVWWVDAVYDALGRVEKRDPPGLPVPTMAATSDAPRAMALDEDSVWFGSHTMQKDGFGYQVVEPSVDPEGIAVVGDYVFETVATGVLFRFLREDLAIRDVFPVASGAGAVTAFDGRVFVGMTGAAGGYAEMSSDGADLVPHEVDGIAHVHHLAVDAEAAFLVAGNIETSIVKVCR